MQSFHNLNGLVTPPAQRRIMVEEARLTGSDPPFRKTKELLDWIKWLVMTASSLIAIGWMGSEYLQRFQTRDDAKQAQTQTEQSLRQVKEDLVSIKDEQFRQRYMLLQQGLETQNASDRLRLVLELQQTRTPAERRAAEHNLDTIRTQIQRRDAILSSPARLEDAARKGQSVGELGGLW